MGADGRTQRCYSRAKGGGECAKYDQRGRVSRVGHHDHQSCHDPAGRSHVAGSKGDQPGRPDNLTGQPAGTMTGYAHAAYSLSGSRFIAQVALQSVDSDRDSGKVRRLGCYSAVLAIGSTDATQR